MKTVDCYNCGEEKTKFYTEENGFALVKCDSCGLLYVKQRPDDMEISHAHKQGIHSGEKELDVKARFNRGKIQQYLEVLDDLFIGNFGKINTWLDIGCGHGEFIIAVQKYSSGKIEIKGTEPNEYKQEMARKKGLNVTCFDISSHNEKYDAISLLNVYSHLTNPPDFIDSLKMLLTPGGELVLQTGDTADLDSKDHVRPFYLPDHLSFASEKIVTGILEKKGFDILKIKKYPFMRFNLKNTVKEFTKVFIPKYNSRIKYYFKIKNYPDTDMYIRAKLKSR